MIDQLGYHRNNNIYQQYDINNATMSEHLRDTSTTLKYDINYTTMSEQLQDTSKTLTQYQQCLNCFDIYQHLLNAVVIRKRCSTDISSVIFEYYSSNIQI